MLRLEGGDPFVFGRGAQECDRLLEEAVDFRVVPGIAAGIGGLAYAGIPVTSQDTNAVVTFITGHTASGDIPDDLDWHSLSKGAPVLVIYVGSRHLARIRERLVSAGRPDDALCRCRRHPHLEAGGPGASYRSGMGSILDPAPGGLAEFFVASDLCF